MCNYDTGSSEFPEFPEFSTSPDEGFSLLRGPEEVSSSGFSCSGETIGETFFASVEPQYCGSVALYCESNVKTNYVELLENTIDPPQSSILRSTTDTGTGYSIRLFVSKDDSYLRQAYDLTDPLPSEVCIFLEDNSGDIFSGASSYITVGDRFREDLAKRNEIAATESDAIRNLEFAYQSGEEDVSIEFSTSQIEELIKTGKIENASQNTLITIFQISNFSSELLAEVYEFLGWAIIQGTNGLRGYIKFSDHHWDPQAINPETGSNSDFEPFFFPLNNEMIEFLSIGGTKSTLFAKSVIKEALDEKRAEIKSIWSSTLSFSGSSYLIPDEMMRLVDTTYQKLDSLLESLTTVVQSVIEHFIEMGSKWINAINAFICGLWNSLVEAILGILDLIGYLFKGLALAGNGVRNAHTLIPLALEMVDEIILALSKADISGMLGSAISTIADKLSKLDLLTMVGAVTIEKVAYFLGAFIGFVAEIVIGMLYSGGLASLNTIGQKFASFGKMFQNLFEAIRSALTRIVGSTAKFSLNLITKIVDIFISILKEGRKAVIRLIDDAFELMTKVGRLTDEAIREIAHISGFSSDLIRYIDGLGFKIASYSDNVCTVCKRS